MDKLVIDGCEIRVLPSNQLPSGWWGLFGYYRDEQCNLWAQLVTPTQMFRARIPEPVWLMDWRKGGE